MTKTLTLIIASTALTAALGIPAWSAMHLPAQVESITPLPASLDTSDPNQLLVLVDDDDNEGGNASHRQSEDDDEDDDECDDDGGNCGASPGAAAPAGSVAPPQNGLFGSGTPKVQVK